MRLLVVAGFVLCVVVAIGTAKSCRKHDGTLYCMGNCTHEFRVGAPIMETISELVLSQECRPAVTLVATVLPGLLRVRCPSGHSCSLADLSPASGAACPCLGMDGDTVGESDTKAPEDSSMPSGQSTTESMAPEPTSATSALDWLWVMVWDGTLSTHQAIYMVIISSLTYLVYGCAKVVICWLHRQQRQWRRACRQQLRRFHTGQVVVDPLSVIPRQGSPRLPTVPPTTTSVGPATITVPDGAPATLASGLTSTRLPLLIPVNNTWLRDQSLTSSPAGSRQEMSIDPALLLGLMQEHGGEVGLPLPPPPSPVPVSTDSTGFLLNSQPAGSAFIGVASQISTGSPEYQQAHGRQAPASSPSMPAASNQQVDQDAKTGPMQQHDGQVAVKPWAAACGVPPIPSPTVDSGMGRETGSFDPRWFQEGRLKLHGASSPIVRVLGPYVSLPTPTATLGTISAIRDEDPGRTRWTLQHGPTAMSISEGTPVGRNPLHQQENRVRFDH